MAQVQIPRGGRAVSARSIKELTPVGSSSIWQTVAAHPSCAVNPNALATYTAIWSRVQSRSGW